MKAEIINYPEDLAVSASQKNKERDYWLNKLSGELVKISFPFDMKWKKMGKPAVQKEKFRIGGTLFSNLMKLAKGSDYTLNVVLLSALYLLIHKYTAFKDIIIGTPIYKQKVEGNFTNTVLALKNRVHGEMAFKELLLEVRQTVVEAAENQNYPIEILVYKLGLPDPGDDFPLFDIGMMLENIHYRKYLGHIHLNVLFFFLKTDEYIDFELEYNSYIYRKPTMEKIGRHFINLLTSALVNIALPLDKIDMLSNQEKKQLVLDFNNNKGDFPKEKTVHHFIEEHAEKSPDRIAVIFENLGLTYRQLNENANQLALYLKKFNIRKEQTVGILLERSPRMMVTILAVWKCEGAYIPIDSQYPTKRIAAILQDSSTTLVISESQYPGRKFYEFYKGKLILLDEIHLQASGALLENPGVKTNTHTLSYVIYTSGSTGNPKGVAVQHIGMMNHIQAKMNDLQLTPGSVIAQNASHTFDISVWQFFAALISGGKTIIYPNSLILDLKQFLSRLIKDNITILEVVPSYLSVLLAAAVELDIKSRKLSQMNYLLVTGEAVKPALVRQWFGTYPDIRMVNAYGPTEASDDITHYIMAMAPGMDQVPIGKPIQNLNIYIVDEHMELCPPGVKGEIVVSGVGVGRGYLNDVEKTANAFMRDPFVEDRKIMLYKTGDLGCQQPDGTITFYGRKDYQVKIRGYRIELEEIENKLAGHPNVKEVVVMNKEDEKGNVFLCAYLAPEGEIEISSIKEYLLENVADYMVPTHFVELDHLPLTPNGKVDRRSLPEPELKAGNSYAAPRNQIENRLAGIWSEVLEIDKSSIGIHDNFFEMGGHSLRATILAGRVHKAFNVKVPLAEIFKIPTINGISEYLKKAKGERYTAITIAEKKEYYPLSSAQKRLYVLQQMDLNSIGYNMPEVMVMEGQMNKGKFEDTFRKLIERHESLETSFEMAADKPVQRIHQDIHFEIEYFDLEKSRVDVKVEAEKMINSFVKPFDLSKAPLLRVSLIKIKNNEHLLLLDVHHIISDGVSEDILTYDFLRLYSGIKLPTLKIQYKDYSEWQNEESESLKQQEKYWLSEFEDGVPALNIPTDYPRPQIKSFEGSRFVFEMDKENVKNLEEIALDTGTTLYIVLLAIYHILLFKISGQQNIVIGTPVAGRWKTDLEQIVGMLVNTLPLKNNVEPEQSFIEFLEKVKEKTLNAFENQNYQFEEMVDKLSVERDMSRNPIFEVMFSFEKWDANEQMNAQAHNFDVKVKPYQYRTLISKFDLELNILTAGKRLILRFNYCTKLFKPSTIERFAGYFRKIVSSVVNPHHQTAADIEIITDQEKTQILYEFNNTAVQIPGDKALAALFDEQMTRRPFHIAVVEHQDKKRSRFITYKQLYKQSHQLAHVLMEKGIQHNTIVGIMVERSVEMIIGILGILKAGGAYLPIDPDYPKERINYMLADSSARVLVTTPKRLARVGANFVQPPELPLQLINIETNLASISEASPSTLNSTSNCQVTTANLAYVIYTSGSTGKPKGVMVEQASVVNLILTLQNEYPLTEADTYLLKTSFLFDVSVTELFGWFLQGGRLAILAAGGEKDPQRIVDTIEKDLVTHINFVPSMFNVFLDSLTSRLKGKLATLKYIFLAGEALTPEIVRKFRALKTGICLENIYGPTEATVYSGNYSLNHWDNSSRVPIGKPLKNIKLYILDQWHHLQPVGIIGELVIEGVGLARGYLNNPELTMEKFTWNPFRRGEKIYRTGDLGRWLPDGNIEFLGRMDHQVKIRGQRVELGEIESQLLKHEIIKEAVILYQARKPVQVNEQENQNEYLCAYVVPKDSDAELNVMDLQVYLERNLPVYMIPSYFVKIEKIPLTPIGKVDRNTLVSYGSQLKTGGEYAAPGNKTEKKLVSIWKEALELDEVGIDDNFFTIGGNSILTIKVINKVKKVFNSDVSVAVMFRFLTIRSFAAYLDQKGKLNYSQVEERAEKVDESKSRMKQTLRMMKRN
jgi:amino acid adenylation domain-containing protein